MQVREARPRGRCPECGKDCAVTPGGAVWGHGWDSRTGRGCGEGALPMTAEECERWDEAEQVRLQEQRAAWEQREQERATQWPDGVRLAFRHFDEESFTDCPWRSPRVAFIAIAADGPVTFACNAGEKRDLLRSEYLVLVAWPGEWSQHVFLLTEQDKAAALAVL